MSDRPIPNLLNDATVAELNADFEIMRKNRGEIRRKHLPSAIQMAAFQQSFNEFIKHRKRAFEPMREVNILL